MHVLLSKETPESYVFIAHCALWNETYNMCVNIGAFCMFSWFLEPKQHGTESALTKTVATLLGNILAVMANEEVMAAAKPTASMDLTMKHRLMKAGPAGTRFRTLQNEGTRRAKREALKSPIVMCQDSRMQSGILTH